jgi:hypothetical protein
MLEENLLMFVFCISCCIICVEIVNFQFTFHSASFSKIVNLVCV